MYLTPKRGGVSGHPGRSDLPAFLSAHPLSIRADGTNHHVVTLKQRTRTRDQRAADLATRCLRRFSVDRDARHVARIITLVGPVLQRVARRRTPSRDSADDLLQETFVVALQAAHRFDSRLCLVPWLIGIMNNLHRARLRRRDPILAHADRMGSSHDPAEVADLRLLAGRLRARVAGLPVHYREVIELYLDRGWNSLEIAGHLGRPHETVCTQFGRAVHRLRNGFCA